MISGFALKSVSVQMMKTFSVNHERFSVWASEMFSLGERTSGEEPHIQFRERTVVGWYLFLPEACPAFPGTLVFHRALFILLLERVSNCIAITFLCSHLLTTLFKCLETEALPYFFLYTWLLLENRGLIVEWTKEIWKNGGK